MKHILSSKCGFATLLDPRGGRSALAGLGALTRNKTGKLLISLELASWEA